MIFSLERVKAVLRIEDIEGYIEYHGAPDDEYDSEAEAITNALNALSGADITEEEALSVITPLWMTFFNLDENEIKKRIPHIRNAVQALLA